MKRFVMYILTALLLASAVVSLSGCKDNDTEPKVPETKAPATEAPATEAATYDQTQAETYDPNRTRALDFTMLNMDGEEVNLFDYVGKPIVLNFWASWCPPCKAEMPDFEEAYKKYGDEVNFLMVNLTDGRGETVTGAKAHVESCGYTFPVFFDTKYEGATIYRISSIPQTYFIDADGYLVTMATGMLNAEGLEQGIQMILEK